MVFAELGRTGDITPEVKAQVTGIATSWAAVQNATIQDIATKIAVNEDKLTERTSKTEDKGDEKDHTKDLWNIVNVKNGEKHMPPQWSGKADKVTFREIRKKVANWADAVYVHGVEVLKFIEKNQDPMKVADLKAMKAELGMESSIDIRQAAVEFKEFDRILFRLLSTMTTGEATTYVEDPGRSGFKAWKRMSGNYDPYDDAGKLTSHTRAAGLQRRAKDIIEARKLIKEWENKVSAHEERHGAIEATSKMTALKSIIPLTSLDAHFRGTKWDTFEPMRNEVVAWMEERTAEEAVRESKGGGGSSPSAMGLGSDG